MKVRPRTLRKERGGDISRMNQENRGKNVYLSKSLFVKGLQCRKALYLQKYHPELMDQVPESQEAVFQAGTEVGEVARDLFPGGVLVPYEGLTVEEQRAMTGEVMGKGTATLYEAAFSHDDVFVKTDILHKGPQGWELYEVKGGTEVKPPYVPDLAVQYFVLTGAGVPVSRASIVHVNNRYVRQGDLEIDQLFTVVDLTETVRDQQDAIREALTDMRLVLQGEAPAIDIGPHCSDPYDCNFRGHCWQHIPGDSIFAIRSAWIDKFGYYRRGIVSFKDLPRQELNGLQRMYTEAFLENTEYLDGSGIKAFLDSLWYPLCFLDFETLFMVAIPIFDGTRPYQQIPFQYSLHRMENEGSGLTHFEYLGGPGTDPRRDLIGKLMEEVPEKACILAYNKNFEIGVLRSLGGWFPEYAAGIDRMIVNFRDLMLPFRNRHYYHRDLWGSYSLKYVLPALVPELSYKGMEISDGAMASDRYLRMFYSRDPEEVEKTRSDLLAYCGLDSLAMVRIVERLREMV